MSYEKVFITGSTGYIGGSVLEGIVKVFPNLQITALLRKTTEEFRTRYPHVQIVQGTFDDFEVIEKAASRADVILHLGDTDHVGCANAILSGLAKRTEPSFLLHLTGTGCIADFTEPQWLGETNPHVWNDITEIDRIYNIPEDGFHRKVDLMVTNATRGLVKTLSIVPPDIYGSSTGVGKRTSYMVPEYIKVIADKEAFYLGKGQNFRAVTHIDDVVSLWVLLLGETLYGGERLQWGKEGFYFAVADEIKWKDAAEAINDIGVRQGWLKSQSKAVSYTADQVGATMPSIPWLAQYIWGSNSRAESARAKALGWSPQGPSFWEVLESDVTDAIESRHCERGMKA